MMEYEGGELQVFVGYHQDLLPSDECPIGILATWLDVINILVSEILQLLDCLVHAL